MSNIDLQTLKVFELALEEDIPGFRVEFKDESSFHQVLGFLTRPFNPFYLTSYISTIGKSVAFPSKEHYESNPRASLVVLGHESVHMRDSIEHGLWGYERTYLGPQLYGLLPLLAYSILAGVFFWIPLLFIVGYLFACLVAKKSRVLMFILLGLAVLSPIVLSFVLTGWKAAVLLAGLACLAPWPSKGRVRWELRGYTTNIAMRHWMKWTLNDAFMEHLIKHFVTGDYYFMSWSRKRTDVALTAALADVESGKILDDPAYAFIHKFLDDGSLLPS